MLFRSLTIISLTLCLCGFCQTPTPFESLSSFVTNINSFNNINPQEKVFLHFDNNAYFIGDTIWFKSYVVTSEGNRKTELSALLHVELLSENCEILEAKKLKIIDGKCNGEFVLRKNYYSGFYEVRAFTRCMFNWGEEAMFSRVFPVFMTPDSEEDYETPEMYNDNPPKREELRQKAQKIKRIDLEFYPESGNIIEATTSRVAIKVVDKDGRSVETEVSVVVDNEVITKCTTNHEGLGSFVFWPELKKYSARVKYENKEYNFPLPEVKSIGYNLNVNNFKDDNLLINVSSSGNLSDETLGISVAGYGKVYYFDTLCVRDNAIKYPSLSINKNFLPQGVNTITLFNSNGDIYCDRMVFIHHDDKITTKFVQGKEMYNPFEKIELLFYVTDNNGNPMETEFSLSVNDAYHSLYDTQKDNIKTNLLLGSELKGYINNPGYYFRDINMKKREDLDNLLLVQGWRRYDFKTMAGIVPFDVKQHVEEGHLVKGIVAPHYLRLSQKNISLFFTLRRGNDVLTGRSISNDDGSFVLDLTEFDLYDDWEIGLYMRQNGRKKYARIELDRFFAPKPKCIDVKEMTPVASLLGETTKLVEEEEKNSIDKMQMIKEVVIKTKKKKDNYAPDVIHDVEKIINEHIDKGERYPDTVMDYLLRYDNNIGLRDGVGMTYKGMRVHFCSYFNDDKAWLRVRHRSSIVNTDILEVYKIEIYEYHPRPDVECGNGVSVKNLILVYIYDNDRLEKGSRVTKLNGYTVPREYYSPDYEKEPPVPGDVNYRRTLYWNPNVKTDKTGSASVEFYNNSMGRKIVVDGQGIMGSGEFVVF